MGGADLTPPLDFPAVSNLCCSFRSCPGAQNQDTSHEGERVQARERTAQAPTPASPRVPPCRQGGRCQPRKAGCSRHLVHGRCEGPVRSTTCLSSNLTQNLRPTEGSRFIVLTITILFLQFNCSKNLRAVVRLSGSTLGTPKPARGRACPVRCTLGWLWLSGHLHLGRS